MFYLRGSELMPQPNILGWFISLWPIFFHDIFIIIFQTKQYKAQRYALVYLYLYLLPLPHTSLYCFVVKIIIKISWKKLAKDLWINLIFRAPILMWTSTISRHQFCIVNEDQCRQWGKQELGGGRDVIGRSRNPRTSQWARPVGGRESDCLRPA